MRFAPWILLSCPVALAWTTFDQFYRCYTALDPSTRIFLHEFLKNASECSLGGQGFATVRCAAGQIPREMKSLLYPLTDALKKWELYYGIELNADFLAHGYDGSSRPELAPFDDSAWRLLCRTWMLAGRLCFYETPPNLAGSLEPRQVGPLTIFIREDDARTPILKLGTTWTYVDDLACSTATERARQARVIQVMLHKDDKKAFVESYSTDPFLQGFITGWGNDTCTCPQGWNCLYKKTPASIYLAPTGAAYLETILEHLNSGRDVCVIFRKTRLEHNKYYIAACNAS